ncbi:MAG: endolytic transglycosylase MltG [Alphaproteobacteria bacterium]|nr:MAG: endolytic transglycosylase MltG [Alphaproteobacteria bacterium]
MTKTITYFVGFLSFVIVTLLVGGWSFIHSGKTLNFRRIPVIIHRGDTLRKTLDQLVKRKIVDGLPILETYIRLTGRCLKPGKYIIPSQLSYRKLLRLLTRSDGRVFFFTVIEGSTPYEVIHLINNNKRLSGPPIPLDHTQTLLGDTYAYNQGESRHKLYKRMQKNLHQIAKKLWAQAQTKDVLPSPKALVILGSIIEKETALSSERNHIAGVFVNRLRKGMRLQADCTVLYGCCYTNQERSWNQGLTKKELKIDTPYNTYTRSGLPPDPIANPGIKSLQAAANPSNTQDLYFVADGTGGHVFSRFSSQHARNHRLWRKIRAEKSNADTQAKI